MSEPAKTSLTGLAQRVTAAARMLFNGEIWMGPGTPLNPVAAEPQQETAGRRFDYPVFQNTNSYTPKRDEGTTFATLRGLADSYDLVRLAVETRKDQVTALEYDFRNRDRKVKDDPRIQELKDFFVSPDKENDWETWLRMVVEDMLVIDAATLYPRKTRGGQLYSLDPVDGATIFRLIDGYGRTPMTPDPAYQQILKGMPAIDYTKEELIYRPRNLRTNRLYGFSPVEQIVTTINIALRRQLYQLSYFTEGNVPDTLFGVPETWTPDQIRDFQTWWDSITTGQTKKRGRFIPGGVNVIDTKASAMQGKDDQIMNEWLARVVCFAFNVTPTQLTVSNNRATSDSQAETADDTGLTPTKKWVKNLIDYIIRTYFGYTDMEFFFVDPGEVDAMKKATVHKTYVDAKVITPDEVRDELGMDPLTQEQKDELNPPPPPGLGGPEIDEDGKPIPGTEGKVPLKPGESKSKEPNPAEKIDVHVHLGDTLVEVGDTVVKLDDKEHRFER